MTKDNAWIGQQSNKAAVVNARQRIRGQQDYEEEQREEEKDNSSLAVTDIMEAHTRSQRMQRRNREGEARVTSTVTRGAGASIFVGSSSRTNQLDQDEDQPRFQDAGTQPLELAPPSEASYPDNLSSPQRPSRAVIISILEQALQISSEPDEDVAEDESHDM